MTFDEKKDAFGNPIIEHGGQQPFIGVGGEKDAFGNPIQVPTNAQQHDLDALHIKSSGDNQKDKLTLIEETNRMITRFEEIKGGLSPDNAKLVGNISPSDNPEKVAELVAKAKDLQNEEETRKIRKEMGALLFGGTALVAGGAALFAANDKNMLPAEQTIAKYDPSILPQDLLDKAVPNKNAQFEKLLAGFDMPKFADPQSVSRADFGSLVSAANLPKLAVAEARALPSM